MTQSFDWRWERAVYINDEISDKLITSLAPQILRLKEEGPEPITVGIDSPGGSISAAAQLLELLKSPGPTGQRTVVITVAINKAFSAAASLLALGDYAVALPSAQIHYHDVRFSTFFDLTSAKAQEAARDLRRENDQMALRLANSVVERLVWLFIHLQSTFEQAKKDFPGIVEDVNALGMTEVWAGEGPKLDFTGFVCAQYAHTSPEGDSVIQEALEKLKGWRKLEIAFSEFNKANQPGKNEAALFRDDNPLVTVVNNALTSDKKFSWTERKWLKRDLVLLLLLLLDKAARTPALRINEPVIADLMTDFAFFSEIRRREHTEKSGELILENDFVFFDRFVGQEIKNAKTNEERSNLSALIFPQVQLFWAYVVLLARSLFDGEHPISLDDALFLGLVDEIPGHGTPKPRRNVMNEIIGREQAELARSSKPLRKWLRPRK